jgi:hypothetical protein
MLTAQPALIGQHPDLVHETQATLQSQIGS